jgi:MoxR-like ATPase
MSTSAHSTHQKVADLGTAIGRIIKGKQETIQLAIVALLAEGHLLIEDVPGVGKTTLGHAMAMALGSTFHRL